MKVQNRNVNLLHENINILQNELAKKNEIIKSLMEIQSIVFDSVSAGGNNQTISDQQQQQQQQQSQQLLEHNTQAVYGQQEHQYQQQIQQNHHTQNIQLQQSHCRQKM